VKPHLRLTPEAEADLADAFDYYEIQLPGLGDDFLAAIERHLGLVADNPAQYQVQYREVRRAVVRRFPYAIFYSIEENGVVVLAIDHQARDPAHWKARL
jgi:plasmid stabilization system protein ParE